MHDYSSMVADVRYGNDLHPGELECIQNRRPYVQAALEKAMGYSLKNKYQPTISLVCSGGGYRAMLGSLGAFAGLQEIGLFDAVTYISSLSGSTWALGLLMATRMTLPQLKKYVAHRLIKDFYTMNKGEKRIIIRMFFEKLASSQSLTTVDLFGAFLANHLLHGHFGNDCQYVHLSDQCDYIKDGHMPFPIYTAIDGRMSVALSNPAWYEFTPFEIGSAEYGVYVPSWALGRKFDKGQSINYAPEQSLGFLFGIFGSAFCAHVGLAWDRILKDITPSFMKSVIESFLIKTKIAQLRFSWARVRNFMFGIKDNELAQAKKLKLIDAGIDCNLPYLPVSGQRSERASDIIIFFDFAHSRIPHSLQKAEQYARAKNLKFPTIDYANIAHKTISVFRDETDPHVPVVIYMPRVSDPQLWAVKKQQTRYKKYHRIAGFDFEQCVRVGACNTTNFRYTMHQSRQVMDQMEFNVVANEDILLEVIDWVMQQRS